MYFFLSKTLYFLTMPLTWIVLLILGGLAGPRRWRRKLLLTGAGMLLLLTNGAFVNAVMLWWERDLVTFEEVEACDTGVLLTGFTHMLRMPPDRLHFNEGADRLIHTARLYHEGKIKTILVSGAYKTLNSTVEEAPLIRNALIRSGVPDSAIIMESESRNTHENAVNSAKIIRKNKGANKVMLITSAFHMRRAEACFHHEGIRPVIFPTDFRATNQPYTFEYFIPSVEPLTHWHTLVKEWLGILTYKLLGYI
jgi:uncharacterized SAM-binding protein YcdF (DUF218 family)